MKVTDPSEMERVFAASLGFGPTGASAKSVAAAMTPEARGMITSTDSAFLVRVLEASFKGEFTIPLRFVHDRNPGTPSGEVVVYEGNRAALTIDLAFKARSRVGFGAYAWVLAAVAEKADRRLEDAMQRAIRSMYRGLFGREVVVTVDEILGDSKVVPSYLFKIDHRAHSFLLLSHHLLVPGAFRDLLRTTPLGFLGIEGDVDFEAAAEAIRAGDAAFADVQ